jgi:hypothetical protein
MGNSKSNSIKKKSISKSNSIKKKSISSCQFKEIIVAENFEVENGVVGLDRDIYLSIVKFLNSSAVRKV